MDRMTAVAGAKQEVRERIWELLEREGAARFPGTRGRIPNFPGAEAAAARLAELPEWRDARVVKANPDAPQLPVRATALAEGKQVYMAVPRLAEDQPFMLLDPDRLTTSPRRAASIRAASQQAQKVGIDGVPRIDLVVCGTVAVNREGVRVGKGGGFSDLEFGLLAGAGSIDERTVLVTTVHPVQIVDGPLPETEHDFRVNRIVTAEEVISCPRAKRPPGILWDHLDEAKIAAVPALRDHGRAGPHGRSK
ncbi:MAG: 5-formyltetrahydrofolate cyclo-ligase [Streptosporangiales bacterium]|nr:5-formyltetrahydrofolate cyclo-ligase [Streptosporangiales bacterium]